MNATRAIRSSGKSWEISRTLLLLTALALGWHLGVRAQGYIYQELYAFPAYGTNGTTPAGALVQGIDGNFYGTCQDGGQPTTNHPAGGYGTVFKMAPEGALATVAWFGYTNGAYPFGAMIQATDGNMYGTAGATFRLTPGGSLTGAAGGNLVGDPFQGTNDYIYAADAYYHVVYWSSPDGATNGLAYAPGSPSGGLIQASDGNFYGLTSDGGTYGYGTAYRLTPGGVLTTLVSFGTNPPPVPPPIWPYGKMLQASDGNLYGVADSENGTIFKLTLAGGLSHVA